MTAQPEPTIDRRIGEIWRQVLGRPDLADETTFFEAGGQSIAAVRIVAQIEDEFGLDVNMGDLFDDPDLTTFVSRVAKLAQDTNSA
jgi:acyl carrier protein